MSSIEIINRYMFEIKQENGYNLRVTYNSNEFNSILNSLAMDKINTETINNFIIGNLNELKIFEDYFSKSIECILSFILKQNNSDLISLFKLNDPQADFYTFIRKSLLNLKPLNDLNDSSKHSIFINLIKIIIKLASSSKEIFECFDENGIYEIILSAWSAFADYFKDHFAEIGDNSNLLETLDSLSNLLMIFSFQMDSCYSSLKGNLLQILIDYRDEEIYLERNSKIVDLIIFKCLICLSNCFIMNINDNLISKRIDYNLLNYLIRLQMKLMNTDVDLEIQLESLNQFIKFYIHNFPFNKHEIVNIAVEYLPTNEKICEFFCKNKYIGLQALEKVIMMFESSSTHLESYYFKVLIEHTILNEEILNSGNRAIILRVMSLLYKISDNNNDENIFFRLKFKEMKLYEYFLNKHSSYLHCQHILLMMFTNLINKEIYEELTITKFGEHEITNNTLIQKFLDFIQLFIKSISSAFYSHDTFNQMKYPAYAINNYFRFSDSLVNFNKLISTNEGLHSKHLCKLCIQDKEILNMFFGIVKHCHADQDSRRMCLKFTDTIFDSSRQIDQIIKNDQLLFQLLKRYKNRSITRKNYNQFYFSENLYIVSKRV